MVITGTCRTIEDVKRLYLPGIVLRDDCEKCKRSVELDMADNYPWGGEGNGIYKVSFSCPDCEEGWSKRVKLTINLEEV